VKFCSNRELQATIIIGALGVAGLAMGTRAALRAYRRMQTMPKTVKYIPGGFNAQMTRKEAAQILGV
jgi:hypothetical protein